MTIVGSGLLFLGHPVYDYLFIRLHFI